VPSAAADPDELRSFAVDLKRFNSDVQSQLTTMRSRFGRLGESWKDQEHAKFAEIFGKMLGTYLRMVEASEQHIPVLTRKAQRLQDYLGPQTGSTRYAADISSVETIQEFRMHFIKFEQRAKDAVSGVRSDCGRILQWLRHDQLQFWKEELRKSEEIVRQARSAYLLARHGADALRKPSYIEEEKALKKAERRKDEAERKIEAVKKWSVMLEQQILKLMGPVNNLSGVLDSVSPTARSRLDRMTESLDGYLQEPIADVGNL
jgi:uncharacterized protein YukE